jgi:hypothetical protein
MTKPDDEDERAMLGQLRKKAVADVEKGKAVKKQLVSVFPYCFGARQLKIEPVCSLSGILSSKGASICRSLLLLPTLSLRYVGEPGRRRETL